MKYILGDPYDYNTISLKKLKKSKQEAEVPTPVATLMDPLCNLVAKFLGVEKHEWSEFYPQVYFLTHWAKEKTKSEDPNKVVDFLKEVLNHSPQMNTKRINDLYVAYKLDQLKTDGEKPKKEETQEEPNKFTFEVIFKQGEVKSK